ncbi:hypothetical protein CISG_10276 [Coccidioides immitis RMSCC 3703]|uniref:Uncharacterized protein n=1 Tax=Coccidioides immitis RMSCC 3703 TaxID=454286 RepID=A0A0J8QPU3_COCIT|nr:hypothetical protein CISG_10276 [Coccidioides immitis RMSCC 3703]
MTAQRDACYQGTWEQYVRGGNGQGEDIYVNGNTELTERPGVCSRRYILMLLQKAKASRRVRGQEQTPSRRGGRWASGYVCKRNGASTGPALALPLWAPPRVLCGLFNWRAIPALERPSGLTAQVKSSSTRHGVPSAEGPAAPTEGSLLRRAVGREPLFKPQRSSLLAGLAGSPSLVAGNHGCLAFSRQHAFGLDHFVLMHRSSLDGFLKRVSTPHTLSDVWISGKDGHGGFDQHAIRISGGFSAVLQSSRRNKSQSPVQPVRGPQLLKASS